MTMRKKPFGNIVRKGENAKNQHFFFSHNVFYLSKHKFQFLSHIYVVVCKFNALILDWSNILSFGRGLKLEILSSHLLEYPFPKRQILDSSKLKEFADDNS